MLDMQKAYTSVENVKVFVNHNIKAGFLRKDSSVDELLELIQRITKEVWLCIFVTRWHWKVCIIILFV